MTTDEIIGSFIVSEDFMEKLKFYECLPKPMVQKLLRERMLSRDDIRATLGRNVTVVEEDS